MVFSVLNSRRCNTRWERSHLGGTIRPVVNTFIRIKKKIVFKSADIFCIFFFQKYLRHFDDYFLF